MFIGGHYRGFDKKMPKGCHGFSEVKDVFSYQSSLELNASDYTCLQSLSFSVNELLVLRQVNYYKRKGNYNVMDSTKTAESLDTGRRSRHRKSRRQLSLAGRELFLGNGVWFSQLDRPSSYQLPLYSYEFTHNFIAIIFELEKTTSSTSIMIHCSTRTVKLAAVLTRQV
ncbi:hypothetical protein EB796_015840 [Bugula neritina]|uniref:Uncharacterized protein n=1 Tax=Bugula neritina TaxID=10212 RepID=A0A7J7JHM9_BUGNE|nr:hypothetical protein EB796_015840 [Bugula neritina]